MLGLGARVYVSHTLLGVIREPAHCLVRVLLCGREVEERAEATTSARTAVVPGTSYVLWYDATAVRTVQQRQRRQYYHSLRVHDYKHYCCTKLVVKL